MRSLMRSPLLACAGIFAACLGVFATCTAVACAAPAAPAQDPTQPAATQHALFSVQGRGVQIYTCRPRSGSYAWIFLAPAARLFFGDREVGTHGDGPVWHLEDGSSVYGQLVAQSPSPDATAIPWLLLKAVVPPGASSRPGTLASVELIRRSDTQGGIAPTTGCDATHDGDLARVPYIATYTFYSSNYPPKEPAPNFLEGITPKQ
jgi:Protein of unknown function (DUF3455)